MLKMYLAQAMRHVATQAPLFGEQCTAQSLQSELQSSLEEDKSPLSGMSGIRLSAAYILHVSLSILLQKDMYLRFTK